MKKSVTKIFTSIFLCCVITVQAQEQDSVLTNFLQKAQYKQAIEYIDAQETGWNLEYQKALCYKYLNNYSSAIGILENLQKNYPDNIPVLLELARCYEINIQYPQSIYYYEKLIEADPDNIYFQVRKADLLYRAEKYAAALDDYLQIAPETYNPAYLKKSIALCYEKLNQPDSAKVYYQAAWEMDANDVFSVLSLVKLCIRQEDYTQALQYSENFLAADTTNVQMNVLNAFTYYSLNNYKEAARRLEKCRMAGDSSLMVIRSLGISYYFLQNDEAAYPCLQQACKSDSTNTTALYALASVSYNLKYYQEAIRAYYKLIERALPNKNALSTYYAGLAQACEKEGLFYDASMHYISATGYASSNTQQMELFFNLAVLMETNLKDYKSAVKYYTQYQGTLINYQDALLDKPDPDPEKVKEIEIKLDELGKYIRKLRTEHKIDYTDNIWNN